MYSLKDYQNHVRRKSKKYISENLEEFTSSVDFKNYFGYEIDKHIIKYSDLKNYRYITYLLKYDGDFKIMLYEQQQNTGHWVLLLRNGKNIEYFDSYGNPPNQPLSYSNEMNDFLDQKAEYLNNLLLNQDQFNIIYNKYKFQSINNNSGTCGKHLIFRLVKFKCEGMNLIEYIEYFKKMKIKFKLNNDNLITLLIPVGNE